MTTATRKMPDIPDEILIKILGFLAVDGLEYLAPILKAGHRGLETALSPQVLKVASIFTLCWHPTMFQAPHHPNGRVQNEGFHRRIFKKCLDAGNKQAIFFEGFRVVAEVEDIKQGIALLTRNVPAEPISTLACGFFSMLVGNCDMATHFLELFDSHHYPIISERARFLAKGVFRLLCRYQTARVDTYRDTFVYPIAPFIPSPECGQLCLLEHGFYSLNYQDYDIVLHKVRPLVVVECYVRDPVVIFSHNMFCPKRNI